MTSAVRARLTLGLLLASLPAGCGGASTAAPTPAHLRPGLEGAVRPEMGPPQPGDPAPTFTLPTSGGGSFSLEEARGDWVVLHFTATFCPYCDVEVEHLSRRADAYADRPVRVVLIDVKEPAVVWRAYAAARVRSPRLVLLEDTTGEVAARYAPEGAQPSFEDRSQVMLAATLIVDPEGTIRLFLLVDSRNFDPTLAAVWRELDRMMEDEPASDARGALDDEAGPTAPLLAPERVVTVEVHGPASVSAGERGELVVHVRVADGYHVMSDRPSSEFYIPTALALSEVPGIRLDPPRYPAPIDFRLLDSTIRTFAGAFEVRVPFAIDSRATPGGRELVGVLGYQACTDASCLFPAELPIRHRLDVVAGP